MNFRLMAVDTSGARRSSFETAHGKVECPAFMPVGTRASVKACTPAQVAETGAEVVLANTYHLAFEGRRELVRRAGGLHRMMAWDKTILTDSGGFQVFSLPGKEVTKDGVWLPVLYDEEDGKKKKGERMFLSPEESMAIQRDLGADIVMAFDQCVEYPASRRDLELGVDRTTDWAAKCLGSKLDQHQFLFGIVQGGTENDLRTKSATEVTSMDFPGYAIGGVSVGEGLDLLKKIVAHTAPLLPEDAPRYLMGVGLPEDIVESVERGIDMFDCVIPTRYARFGTLFTRKGKIRISDKKYRKDKYPVDTACACYTCRNFSRMYLRHLHYAKEPLFETLATIHNLHFYQDLMRGIRESIEKGRFAEFKASVKTF
ncbi:MAG: tRNA guanosine(34) transglycosylase Tgt [Planctomycetes bacterium]|nr:tRNA guanosine(34) transglycosylase Tgt [Planctomycetota bacterium]